jgi:PPOX class probable F420-dependent enzyme
MHRVKLTDHLPLDRRSHVEARLQGNLMAWLTTVRPDGRPVSVPVWFLLRDDETFLVYSKPSTAKLRNLQDNPNVALGLDVTDLGRDVIRLEGTAAHADTIVPAHQNRQYVAKYMERIGAIFGTAEKFAELYSVPVVITPTRLWA